MVKTKKRLVLAILSVLAAVCMLFAACEENGKVKLKFEMNGAPAIESVELDKGETYTLPTPEWTGHSFEGWFETSDFSGSPVVSVTAEGDRTFYAKWEETYPINLDLAGGTLEAGTTFYAKAGTNISSFMEAYVPTYGEDHLFGEWLVGTTPLSPDETLTSAGINLKAHYKIAYTVERHMQNVERTEYVQDSFRGYEYITGDPFTPSFEGFTAVAHEGSTAAKPLTENVSDNQFTLWYDRNEVTVTLDPNYPYDLPATAVPPATETIDFVYGQETILPAAYSFAGYALTGWSTSPNGEKEYDSDFIGSRLKNGTYAAEAFTAKATETLYAVWTQGYTDLFGGLGGGDIIFHFAEDAEDIYLLRGDVLFRGEYQPKTGLFLFFAINDSVNEAISVQGKLSENHTYVYYDDDRASRSYNLYSIVGGKNDTVTIRLDTYDEITYTDISNHFQITSGGNYWVDGEGYYHVAYTTGSLKGQSFVYLLSTGNTSLFMVRDETEYGWGTMHRGAINQDGKQVYYNTEIYSLTLNGFGVAAYTNADGSSTQYYYSRKDDVVTLLDKTYGTAVAEAHITEGYSPVTYMLRFSQYANTYISDSGDMLVLDGLYNATYLNSNSAPTDSGVYTLSSSVFGTLVNFFSKEGKRRLFLAVATPSTETAEDGTETTVYSYSFKEVPVTYAEYKYMAGGSIYYAPLIVLDEEKAGEATVYNYQSGEYVRVLKGAYTSEDGVYTFTANDTFVESSPFNDEFDIAEIKSITFSTAVVATSSEYYAVTYWHSVTFEDPEEPKQYDKTYTSDEEKLTVTNGYAVYTYKSAKEGGTFEMLTVGGVFSTVTEEESASVPYDAVLYDAIGGKTYYFLLDEEQSKFTLLNGLLGSIQGAYPDEGNAAETLAFDGLNGATFTVVKENEDGSEGESTEHKGTYERTDDVTPFGFYIYQFKPEDESAAFKFILVPVSSSSVYFFKENKSDLGGVQGEDGSITFTKDSAKLTLDGFNAYASYSETGSEEDAVLGLYALSTDGKSIRLTGQTRYYYFDIEDGNTFKVRDSFYGSYLYLKNQSLSDLIFNFDGYGKLTVSGMVSGEDGESSLKTIDENGKYTVRADGYCELSYTVAKEGGSESVTLKGYLGRMSVNGSTYNVFIYSYEEIVNSYVNEDDLSVLELDSYGNAVRYNKNGVAENGRYVIVTDDLLYYANADGSDACIYTYDKGKGTAKPVKNDQKVYYSANFDALIFTTYGFMIMNGETRYYFNKDADGTIVLYQQDPENENANKYGFVEKRDFGKFESEKTYDNTTYYESTTRSLTFTREDSDKEKYPIPVSAGNGTEKRGLQTLTFSPSGAAEFTDSSATVAIESGEKPISCTVERLYDEEEEKYQMFMVLRGTRGNFVIEIEVKYEGGDKPGSYKILSMQTQTVLNDVVFLSQAFFYMLMGYSVPNTFGYIILTTNYTEAGDAETPMATGVFGEVLTKAGLADSQGNNVSFSEPYEYSNGTYSVTFEAEDEKTYSLYFSENSTYYQYTGLYAYGILAFTSHEELKDEDGDITVDVERILFSESSGVTPGGIYNVTLSEEEGEIDYNAGYIIDDSTIYFLSRKMEEVDEDAEGNKKTPKIESTTLYIVTLTMGEALEEGSDALTPIKSVKVETVELSVAYDETGTSYVEYNEEKNWVVTYYNGRGTYVFTQEKCENENDTYTVTTSSGKKFEIKITEGDNGKVLTVTEVAEETEESANADA